jgi:hypothetical protein
MEKTVLAGKNEFFDINRLPSPQGMLIFGLSMSRLANTQDAAHCWKYLEHLVSKLKDTEGVGLLFLYADYLYMYSDESAAELRDKFLGTMYEHRKKFQSILLKNPWYIKKAFSYITWGQALMNTNRLFLESLRIVEQAYKKDKKFQACVAADIKRAGRSAKDPYAKKFIMEEAVLFQLMAKGQVMLPNEYINHQEKWILFCYPGKPLMTEVYLAQKNPLKFKNPQNRFENSFYDLEGKKLYNYLDIDLEKDAKIFE